MPRFALTTIFPFIVSTSFVVACDQGASGGFFDGGAPADAAATTLYPIQTAFLAGKSAQYHNLGGSTFTRGGPPQVHLALTGAPSGAAPVHPIYFFFEDDGTPLFSPPWKNETTGQFFMRARKGNHEFHRPIIDLTAHDFDSKGEGYSGLWQVVKVIVPKGHKPNAIMSAADLHAAHARSPAKVKIVPTAFAINCPLVVQRAHVVPNATAYQGDDVRIPQPQVELWYRNMGVECFLANGWETLGRAVWNESGTAHVYQLLSFDDDEARVQTFDVHEVARNDDEPIRLVAPVGLLFVPHTQVQGQDIFLDDMAVFAGPPPRRRRDDPWGYRPIRWVWNLRVKASEEQPLHVGHWNLSGLTDASRIDPARLSPREPITVINAPLSGARVSCEGSGQDGPDPCEPLGLICDARQGGWSHTCALPKVRYGAPCGPALGQCRETVEDHDVIERWFVEGAQTHAAANVVPHEVFAARTNAPIVRVDRHALYRCVAEDKGVGRCLLSCDPTERNVLHGQTVTTFLDKSLNAPVTLALDSRCGGALMPGFACEPQTKACVRSCTVGAAEGNACHLPTPMWLSDDLLGVDLAKHTTCRKLGSVSGCFHASPSSAL